MKNYEVLEEHKKEIQSYMNERINEAFDKGYEQGYESCKVEQMLNDDTKCQYQEGYNDGYRKGINRGKEYRVMEADCAYQCGLRKAWECIKKLKKLSENDRNTLFKYVWLNDILDKFSPNDVITKLEEWEKKQEGQRQPDKVDCKNTDCTNCIDHLNCDEDEWKLRRRGIVPAPSKEEQSEKSCYTCKNTGWAVECSCCGGVDNHYSKWTPKQVQTEIQCKKCAKEINAECVVDGCKFEPKQDAPEMNVDSIDVGDEVICQGTRVRKVVLEIHDFGELGKKYVCFGKTGISTEGGIYVPIKTGYHYDIKSILDAMRNHEVEEKQ